MELRVQIVVAIVNVSRVKCLSLIILADVGIAIQDLCAQIQIVKAALVVVVVVRVYGQKMCVNMVVVLHNVREEIDVNVSHVHVPLEPCVLII